MTSPTTNYKTLDESGRAHEIIETWLALDPEAQDETLARLIAATLHEGRGSALEAFAGSGRLDGERALEELNDVRVPLDREDWVDLLGRFILAHGGRS
jgi:hypothetical protein